MGILWIAGIFAAAILYFLLNKWYQEKKLVKKIDAEWSSSERMSGVDIVQAGHYFDLWKESNSASITMDNATWNDLEMSAIYRRMDHCQSMPGRQVLYRMLHTPEGKPENLSHYNEIMDFVLEKKEVRNKLQLLLNRLNSDHMWYVSQIFMKDLPGKVAMPFLFRITPFLAVCCILVAPFYWQSLLGLIAIGFINTGIHQMYKKELFVYSGSLSDLRSILFTGDKIRSWMNNVPVLMHEQNQLDDDMKQLRPLKKVLKPLIISSGSTNEALDLFNEYINRVFLIDVNVYVRAHEDLRVYRKEIQRVYEAIGLLDALTAVASFRESLPVWSRVAFTGNHKLEYKQVYNPLLEEPVANDISLSRDSVLLTGSNMSGKSTFIRTLGINQLLAQTFGFACSEEAELTVLGIAASIRNEDDLLSGKSFYQTEVERVKQLLDQVQGNQPFLVLLDEIFRGTNTIERIAASREVLAYLSRYNGWVIAATHDLELIDLLDHFRMFHFREFVEEGEMRFDYKLRTGPASTRNAIAVLELSGYPDSIVKSALSLAEVLEDRYQPINGNGVKSSEL
ncbi:MAG TPA: hypothetical protein VKA08_09885 [Balneolales bacterium]|nr:hypothetical protein [Balneolales bacterium]